MFEIVLVFKKSKELQSGGQIYNLRTLRWKELPVFAKETAARIEICCLFWLVYKTL